MRNPRLRIFYTLSSLLAGAAVGASACAGSQTEPAEPASASVSSEPIEAESPGEVAAEPAPSTATPAEAPAAYATMDTDTLRLEGTPEVPDAVRARLNQYLEARSAGLSDLRADGKQILIGTRFGETYQAHLVQEPLGARTQVTFAIEPVSGAEFVPGDDSAIVYSADIGGNEQHQIFRLDLDTGKHTRLTDAEARNGALLWSTGGKWMAYSSNARNKRDFDIWIADGRDPASAQRIVDAQGWWFPLDWSPDDSKLLVGQYLSINESVVHVVDVESKQVTRLSPEADGDGKAAYGSARFGRDGETVYLTSDREGEFTELYQTDVTGTKWRPLTRDIPWDVEDVAMSPDGRTLAFTTNEHGYSVLHLLDTRSGKHRPVKNVPKGIIGGLQFAGKAPVLGFTFASATRTGDAYTYDVRRRRLTQWTESEMGGLSRDTLIEPELIRYETFDGKEIPAFYYRPRGAGPFPVIINIHGGPEGQSRPRFSALTQYALAESGMAVIYPNVRGSAGYGKSYLLLDNGMQREASVKDIGALLDWIATRPELDAERVGVLGGSYGGYMVLAALTHFGERIAAGVDIVGISNFVTFLENTADYRRDLRRAEYGDERDPEMRAHLEQISPTNRVDAIQSALFVAQGANDPRVPASEAEQIVSAVREAGHDVWYMLAKNEGHGFAKKENRNLYYQLTMMFFEKHLAAGGN